MSVRKSSELAGKRLVRAGLRLLFTPSVIDQPPEPADVKRVCVVRGDNRLGNLLLVTPLLRETKRVFPAARLDVLISGDSYPDVYRDQSFIDEILTAPKKKMARNPLRTIPFSKRLREREYDVVIDASHMHEFSLTTAWAARLTRARWRVGYARGDAELFLNWLVDPIADDAHECDVHLQLLRSLLPDAGVAAPLTSAPVFELSESERSEAHERFRAWSLRPREAIGLFVGARGKKKWPVSQFVELAERIIDTGTPCVLFGGPIERDALSSIQTRATIAPPLEVREFGAALEQCRRVVSADTGPMHLAVAVGRPSVQLFLASDPGRYGYGHLDEHVVLHDDITVDTVFAAIRRAEAA